MNAPTYRHRPRRSIEDEFQAPIESRSAFREYSPIVFGGIMLVAAFAFAGHQIGRNASASTTQFVAANVAEEAVVAPTQTLRVKRNSTLMSKDENLHDEGIKSLRRATVVADGKVDLLILDPGEAPEAGDDEPAPKAKKKAVAKLESDKRIKIVPASVNVQEEEEKAAAKIAKKLALAPKPAESNKSLKLKKAEKQKALAKRRLRLAEENCLARAIYFEARSESEAGQLAVAKVILNRTKAPNYPKTICGVVYQGSQRRNSCQFSFACDGLPDDVKQPEAWSRAKRLANKTMDGDANLGKAMNTATNYHADYVKPKWAKSMRKLVKIGTHIFYTGG